MGSVHPIRVNPLRHRGPPSGRIVPETLCRCGRSFTQGAVTWVCSGCKCSPQICCCRPRSLEVLGRTDPRLEAAISQVERQGKAVLDALAAAIGAEQDGAAGMALVRVRSEVATARRELARLEEALRQCRWEALHQRMRRLRHVASPTASLRAVQLALFDLKARDAGATYWPEAVRAA